MAAKEGRCPNCGSLCFLNPGQEKSHCPYCDAVFQTEEALTIAKNPAGYTFPNVPQPKYEGPDLNSGSSPVDFERLVQSAKAAQPKRQETVQEVKDYVPKCSKVPDLNIPRPTKIKIFAALGAFVLILSVLVVPLSLARHRQRTAILELMMAKQHPAELGKTIEFQGFQNDRVYWYLDEKVDEKGAIEHWKEMVAYRDEALGAQDSASRLQMNLIWPDGGFRLEPDGQGSVAVQPAE